MPVVLSGLFVGLEAESGLFCETSDMRQIWGYNGWQMRWPAPGPQSKQGVCLYKLISQTKRALCPTSCFGSRQSVWSGKERALRFTWQNKMGPQHDREDNISASKASCLLRWHIWTARTYACSVFRLGSDRNTGSYKVIGCSYAQIRWSQW